jgi:5-methyltetrahydrofolate--homocysteine methyltransferase
MSRFLNALRSGDVMLMDGAMGTELQRAGLREAECPEYWNLSRPDEVRKIHTAYREAGSQCFLTNTFQSHPAALTKYSLEDQLEVMNQAALALARSVAGNSGFVIGDIGPLETKSHDDEAELRSVFRVARSLVTADALLFETCSHFSTFVIVNATRQFLTTFAKVPILVSFTFQRTADGAIETFDGRDARFCAKSAQEAGVEALGVNCGREISMQDIKHILQLYRQETDLPLFARPNAGSPVRPNGHWNYPQTPGQMATRLPQLLEAGVSMIGGCCGTRPAHIAAFQPIIEHWNSQVRKRKPRPLPG